VATKTFGELLRQYRSAAGFSQEHLAGEARISVESVGALERGARRAPYRDTVAVLAKALNLAPGERADLEAAANRARSRASRNEVVDKRPAMTPGLPLQSTSFIGRTQDIAAITGLLEQNRLVTVTGSGGVGKTRAIVEVAGRLPAARWPDMRFVDLSPLTDGAFIVGAIATRLDVPLGDTAGAVEGLIASLRSSHALIVLDNCEHLIADVALVVSAVLQSCAQVSFLATSRERLAVSGETVYRLPSLELPTKRPESIEQARQYAAIDLFVQRAGAFDHTLAFTAAGIDDMLDICARLDGIPLAIELAAARVSTLGLRALRERLSRGLALSGGARNLPARQQTMRATIAWSYDLLGPQERSLLQRLALFAGGFSLAAAEAVCASDELEVAAVPDLLSSLVDKSLVGVVVSETTTRYALLESVRSFGLEQLAEARQTEIFSRRHAEWLAAFGDWVDANRAAMPEGRLRIEVDPELDNARSALAWVFGDNSAENALVGARIVGGLRTIWLTSGRRNECEKWANSAIDSIDQERHPHIAARLLRALIQSTGGPRTLSWADRALPVFESIDDQVGIALLHAHIANLKRRQGLIAEADEAIQRGTKIFALGNVPKLMPYAAFLHTRIIIHLEQGRYEEALRDIAEGRAIVKALGDHHAFIWWTFEAEVRFMEGDAEAALRLTEAALEGMLEDATSYSQTILTAYLDLAVFRVASGDVDGGYAAARKAALFARTRNFDDITNTSYNSFDALALVAASVGEPRVAARLSGALDARTGRSHLYASRFGGGVEAVARGLLLASLREQLTLEAIERLESEGASLPIHVAMEEALRIYAEKTLLTNHVSLSGASS
jgi:predicted ATPase/DNA-binding XRE family transcriptional regulator